MSPYGDFARLSFPNSPSGIRDIWWRKHRSSFAYFSGRFRKPCRISILNDVKCAKKKKTRQGTTRAHISAGDGNESPRKTGTSSSESTYSDISIECFNSNGEARKRLKMETPMKKSMGRFYAKRKQSVSKTKQRRSRPGMVTRMSHLLRPDASVNCTPIIICLTMKRTAQQWKSRRKWPIERLGMSTMI